MEDEMFASLLENRKREKEQTQDPLQNISENQLEIKLAKLSMSMKSYCGIHLRYVNDEDSDSLNGLLMLNPECQIKVLEKNLNFLFKKESRCNYIQVKGRVDSTSKASLIGCSKTLLEPKLLLNDSMPLKLKLNKNQFQNEACQGGFESEELSNRKAFYSDVLLPVNEQSKPKTPTTLSNNKSKDKKTVNNKKTLGSSIQLKSHSSSVRHLVAGSEISHKYKNKTTNDADNQYEFTAEHEKIVSFVCSPSPERKCIVFKNPIRDDKITCSDQESDKKSELSMSKGDSSETISNTSSKSNASNKMFTKEVYPAMNYKPESSKLLWHPPTSHNYKDLVPINPPSLVPAYKPSWVQNILTENTNVAETIVLVHDPTISSSFQKRMDNSFNRETTLFREASLRGCNNMENLIKNMVPPMSNVQQEISKVRESVFSAVRVKRSPDDFVSDSILSILDICKSWLKFNSHFERNEFKDLLQSHGSDLSIIDDFLQWQCVSRVFIDKMINTLQTTSRKRYSATDTSFPLDSLKSKNFATSQRNGCFSDFSSGTFSNCNLLETQSNLSTSRSELNSNKHWKQRRFQSDQIIQQLPVGVNNQKFCKPNLTFGSTASCNQLQYSCNADVFYGQGDPPVSNNCNLQFCKPNQQLHSNLSVLAQGVNFYPSERQVLSQSTTELGLVDKNINMTCTPKDFKEFCNVNSVTNIFQLCPGNDVPNNCNATAANLPMSPLSLIGNPTLPVTSPVYSNQVFCVNSNKTSSNLSPCLIKQNPIHCIDNEISENCSKVSYMKPGSYNPPQKPTSYLKAVNNTIPIEDTPVVGIPFLYTDSQGNLQPPKVLNTNNSLQKQVSLQNENMKESEETWKAALSMAESFRNNLISFKTDERPNLKLSDTVSFKTHFLLSDQNSQVSSNNDLKLSSESEESSPQDLTNQGLEMTMIEPQVKTSDWLMKSFNKAVLEKEKEKLKVINSGSPYCDDKTDCATEPDCLDEESNIEKADRQDYMAFSNFNVPQRHEFSDFDGLINKKTRTNRLAATDISSESSSTYFSQRKPKRNGRKIREGFNIPVPCDQKPMLYKKPKSVFKKAINKQIAYKLEDILNCICSTEVSSLVELKLNSEKEMSKLELKIRSPLYLQAMRCKLANHSYDTLEQALTDFQQYFVDMKCKNKGDRQCTEVVGALEQVFLGLVEKHFGLMYQPPTNLFNPLGIVTTTKPRKQKKTPRRC